MQTQLQQHRDGDILLTNCGGPTVGKLESFALQHWSTAWQGQLCGTLQAMQTLATAMAERGWGRVIILISVTVGFPMRGFALSDNIRPCLLATLMRKFDAAQDVTANLLCLGITPADPIEKLVQQDITAVKTRGEMLQHWTQNLSVKRLGDAPEIAALVGRDTDGYINGQTLVLNGRQSVAN